MTVQELIEQLQKMPMDARVEVATDEQGQTEATVVSLQYCCEEQYVFIGDY